MILLFLFLFGICIGSFLNVVIYRINFGLSPFVGRSICPLCKHQLSWLDNIPLFSFFVLGRKCRYCKKPISWQYPLVEIGCGTLTIFVFLLSDNILFDLIATWSLIILFVSDFRYGFLPDEAVFGAFFILLFLQLFSNPHLSLIGFSCGIFLSALLFLLVIFTKGKGMGMGDVKYAILMGVILGWPRSLMAMYLAFLTGGMLGVILILTGKKGWKSELPFGPFLTAITWILLFLGDYFPSFFFSYFYGKF